jgi:hypothetical protein
MGLRRSWARFRRWGRHKLRKDYGKGAGITVEGESKWLTIIQDASHKEREANE